MLEALSLTKKYGSFTALDRLDLTIQPGEVFCLLGSNGAGKSTTINLFLNFIDASEGSALIDGIDVAKHPLASKQKLAYIPEQVSLYGHLTGLENLAYLAGLGSAGKAYSRSDLKSFLLQAGLQDTAHRRPVKTYSKGMRQKVGIALAIARQASTVLLDEPTSGLDSQSAWAICAFLRKLADRGRAVLCTVHQPSAVLFQQFDRLLFLAKGGRTVYFGEVGANARTLLDYFESNGARSCGDDENPAEYMLEVVNGIGGDEWHTTWNSSPQRREVDAELERLHTVNPNELSSAPDQSETAEFAMPFTAQLQAVTARVFQQYWRTPSYVLAKFALGMGSGLFIGFSFYQADGSLAGMGTALYSVFMLTTTFNTLVQQVLSPLTPQEANFSLTFQ